MKRRPNPWIVIPALTMGVLAGALGWIVTDVSCRTEGPEGTITTCTGWAFIFAGLAFLGATVGVTILLVLVYRSLSEWSERNRQT